MPIITDVRVRQPAKHELVAERFTVAGIGSGFEGTVGIRLLGPRGKVIATDFAQAAGGMAGVGEFVAEIHVETPPRAGARVTLEAFGDNPGLPDEGPSPGFNLFEVELIMFSYMNGWVLYRVERWTPSRASGARQGTTATSLRTR